MQNEKENASLKPFFVYKIFYEYLFLLSNNTTKKELTYNQLQNLQDPLYEKAVLQISR